MTTQVEYALMAGDSYLSNRSIINQFPVPQGWLAFFHVPNNPAYPNFTTASGFEAISFQNQANPSEIVISYAGTNPASIPDWVANVALWVGSDALQLQQAADYYLQVQALNPNATISFTGHSLGGGLASLMAVMFDKTAVTFDQAPFRNSATASVASDLLAYLQGEGTTYTAAQLVALNNLKNFINAANAAPGTVPNEAQVTDTNVQGEVLGYLPFSRIGQPSVNISQQNDMNILSLPAVELHSLALLTAFSQSASAATSNNPQQTLNSVSFKIPDLLKMIFNSHLYAHSPSSGVEDFLAKIILNQDGAAANSITGQVATAANQMVTRFTDDLWKIAQPGGLTLSNTNLSDALVAYAMDKYYNEKTGTLGAGQELYNVGNGYIEFSTASITTNGLMGNGNRYLNPYLDSAYTTGNGYTQDAASLIRSLDNSLDDWYIQAGGSAMVATDSSNVGAFMLGGAGNDNLTGGLGNNLLVAGSGNDILTGGAGNNVLMAGAGTDSLYGGQGNATLYGGSGNDTFIFDSTNAGTTETINDTSGLGNGMLFDGSAQITGSGILQKTDNTWTDGNHDQYLYNLDTGSMTISQGLLGSSGDKIVIDNFNLGQAESSTGYLGIKFGEQLAMTAGANSADDPFTNGGTYTAASQSATVAVGNVQTITLYAAAADATAQTVTLNGGGASIFVSTGATLLPFNGTLNLVIPARQDHVTVGLVDTSNRSSVDAANDSCNAMHYEKSAA